MSRVLVKNSPRPAQGTQGPGAELMKAMRGLSDQVQTPEFDGLFGQIRKMTVNNSLILQNSAGYDINFEVPFDDDAEINESVITVYNLSQTSLGQIQKDMPIVLEAGYEKDSSGIILSGQIVKVRTYWEDLDKVTEITAKDFLGTKDQELTDISFPANTQGSQILRDLCQRLQIPIACFEVARDHVFENPVKISGSIMDSIGKYAQVCGVSAWISKNSLYVCPLARAVSEGYFDLKADTGLLSVEEWQEETTLEQTEAEKKAGEKAKTETVYGITASMLLQHRIYTGCTIQITSRTVNGQFKVREGSHEANEDEFITTVKAVRMS